jgi:hypothetical protein
MLTPSNKLLILPDAPSLHSALSKIVAVLTGRAGVMQHPDADTSMEVIPDDAISLLDPDSSARQVWELFEKGITVVIPIAPICITNILTGQIPQTWPLAIRRRAISILHNTLKYTNCDPAVRQAVRIIRLWEKAFPEIHPPVELEQIRAIAAEETAAPSPRDFSDLVTKIEAFVKNIKGGP